MSLIGIGAACFGLVIGWITYRTLRRREGAAVLSDIATVIGVVGGAAVTTLFKNDVVFSSYCIGLAIGFFSYFFIGLFVFSKDKVDRWMGSNE